MNTDLIEPMSKLSDIAEIMTLTKDQFNELQDTINAISAIFSKSASYTKQDKRLAYIINHIYKICKNNQNNIKVYVSIHNLIRGDFIKLWSKVAVGHLDKFDIHSLCSSIDKLYKLGINLQNDVSADFLSKWSKRAISLIPYLDAPDICGCIRSFSMLSTAKNDEFLETWYSRVYDLIQEEKLNNGHIASIIYSLAIMGKFEYIDILLSAFPDLLDKEFSSEQYSEIYNAYIISLYKNKNEIFSKEFIEKCHEALSKQKKSFTVSKLQNDFYGILDEIDTYYWKEHYLEELHNSVDTYLPECNLVIQVDGPVHITKKTKDAINTKGLEFFGYNVMRVSYSEIQGDKEALKAKILEKLKSLSEFKKRDASEKITVVEQLGDKDSLEITNRKLQHGGYLRLMNEIMEEFNKVNLISKQQLVINISAKTNFILREFILKITCNMKLNFLIRFQINHLIRQLIQQGGLLDKYCEHPYTNILKDTDNAIIELKFKSYKDILTFLSAIAEVYNDKPEKLKSEFDLYQSYFFNTFLNYQSAMQLFTQNQGLSPYNPFNQNGSFVSKFANPSASSEAKPLQISNTNF